MREKFLNFKNEKGASMVTLVITIVIILILLSIIFVTSLGTINEADYSKYVSNVSDVDTAFKETSTSVNGEKVAEQKEKNEEQVYNYVAKGGKEESDFLITNELPAYTILKDEQQIGISLPQMTVESGTGKRVPVTYATTKGGQIFTWPPYDYEEKYYITSKDTVDDKMQTNITVGNESFQIELDPVDGTLKDVVVNTPTLPEDPENPETPVDPEDPDTPENPDEPDNPVDPDDPDTPDVPDTPDTPEVHVHNFSSEIATPEYLANKATCTSPASYYYKCTGCDAKGTNTFTSGNVLGHEFNSKDTSEKYLASKATCADPATYYYKCTRCDAKGNKAYTNGEALGHDFGEYEITTPASCIDTGLKTRTCTRCSAFETEVIEKDKNNHVGGTETKTEKQASCTETGVEKIYCKSCNAVLETKTLEATGHNFSSKTQTEEYFKSEATCTKGKTYYYKCTKCSEKGTETYTAGDALGHTYGEPTFTWSEDLTSATVTLKCTSNDDTKTINAVITTEIIKEATCEEEGEMKYIATVEFNGKTYKKEKIGVIPANGHQYGDPTINWSEDKSSASADFECSCGKIHTEEAEVTVSTKDPTCEEEGKKDYIANITFGDKTYTDTETEVIAPTGHTGTTEFIWSADYSSAVAVLKCSCGGEERVNATVSSERTEPTCTEKGEEVHTATATFGENTYTNKQTIEIAALGHAYEAPTFSWSEDNTKATATATCIHGDDTKTIEATMTTETIKIATCKDAGEIKYIATVILNETEYTDSRTKEIPSSGHDDIELIEETTKEANCVESGEKIYTCSGCNEVIRREEIPVLGHEYTEQLTTSTYLASEATCTAPATYYYKCERCTDKGETTYEYGEALDHEFTEIIEDEEHLVSEATCTTPAIYYYDCIRCDVIGTLTYESGDTLEHNWNDENPRVCIDCGKVETKTSLVFEQPYIITENGMSAEYIFHEDGSFEIWAMDFEGMVAPEGELLYVGNEIIFANSGTVYGRISEDGTEVTIIEDEETEWLATLTEVENQGIQYDKLYSFVYSGDTVIVGGIVIHEDGSVTVNENGTYETMPVGSIIIEDGKITLNGENTIIPVHPSGNKIMVNIDGGYVILTIKETPLVFNQPYKTSLQGVAADVVFYEDGSASLWAMDLFGEVIPEGMVIYTGEGIIIGGNDSAMGTISADGRKVVGYLDGMEMTLELNEVEIGEVQYGKTYSFAYDGESISAVLNADGSVRLNENGTVSDVPADLVEFKNHKLVVNGMECPVYPDGTKVLAEGAILMIRESIQFEKPYSMGIQSGDDGTEIVKITAIFHEDGSADVYMNGELNEEMSMAAGTLIYTPAAIEMTNTSGDGTVTTEMLGTISETGTEIIIETVEMIANAGLVLESDDNPIRIGETYVIEMEGETFGNIIFNKDGSVEIEIVESEGSFTQKIENAVVYGANNKVNFAGIIATVSEDGKKITIVPGLLEMNLVSYDNEFPLEWSSFEVIDGGNYNPGWIDGEGVTMNYYKVSTLTPDIVDMASSTLTVEFEYEGQNKYELPVVETDEINIDGINCGHAYYYSSLDTSPSNMYMIIVITETCEIWDGKTLTPGTYCLMIDGRDNEIDIHYTLENEDSKDDQKEFAYALVLDNSGDSSNPVPMIFVREDEPIYSGDIYESETYGALLVKEAYTDFEDKEYYLDANDSTKHVLPGWVEIPETITEETRSDVTSVVFEDKIKPISTAGWFALFRDCEMIDLKKLDTSDVTNMKGMFTYCQNLKEIDISHFDTSKVTDMGAMFMFCINVTELDVSDFDTSNVTDMECMFMFCINVTELDVSDFNTSNVTDMGSMFFGVEKAPVLDVNNFDTNKVKKMDFMFSGCNSITELDVSNFNTSNVTNMQYMFECDNLESLDLSSFDTSNVIHMDYMFAGCGKLTNLNLSSFDTSSVMYMNHMFYGLPIASLYLGNFDTSNVVNMENMFDNCINLKVLDLSSFDTNKVEDMTYMFDGCENLTTIYVSDKWFVDEFTGSYDMFDGAINLVGEKGTTYDSNYVDKTYAHIDEGPNNPGYLSYKAAPANDDLTAPAYALVLDNNADENNSVPMIFVREYEPIEVGDIYVSEEYGALPVTAVYTDFEDKKYYVDILYTAQNSILPEWINTSESKITSVIFEDKIKPVSTAGWFYYMPQCKIINIKKLDTSTVKDMSGMFATCPNLISLDVSNFDTSNVTDMAGMFSNCSKLTNLDVSNFDTSNVTNMLGMFTDCSKLTNLDLSNFNTENVENMAMMFLLCSNLTTLNISSFSTNNVKNMTLMFANCKNLINLDVSYFNTSKVSVMADMFSGCNRLTSLDVSNFETHNVISMVSMFSGCESLTSLDVGNFNTENVTEMDGMFRDCSQLTELNVSNFDTKNVTGMYEMFKGCNNLTSLDVSNFETHSVTDMDGIFEKCSKLTKLDLSNFNTSNVTDMREMFEGCTNLITLDLMSFDTSKVEYTEDMFANCTSLTTIYVSDKWTMDNLKYEENMFTNATNLVGEKGTTYNSQYVDQNYAHIDEGPTNPGYLSTYFKVKYDNSIRVGETITPTVVCGYGKFNSSTASKYYEIIDGEKYVSINSSTGEITGLLSGTATIKLTIIAGDGSKISTETTVKVFDNYFAIYSNTDNSLTFYNREEIPEENSIYNEKNVTEIYIGFNHETYTDINSVPWNAVRKNVKTVVVADNVNPYSTENWFYEFVNCSNFELENLDTANVVSMKSMFEYAGNTADELNILGIDNFDTSNVKDMSNMFATIGARAINLEDFLDLRVCNIGDLSSKVVTKEDGTTYIAWNTSNVIDMSNMFNYAGLRAIEFNIGDIGTWNTENVISMSKMFGSTASLVTSTWYVGDLSKWNTSNLTNMSGMFIRFGIGDATYNIGDIGNWDTSNVTDMSYMFQEALENTSDSWYLGDIGKWDTSNVEDMSYMFQEAFLSSKLEDVGNINNWDTSNVKDMNHMFAGCVNLQEIDLRGFDTTSVTNMSNMFSYCRNLKTINVSNFDTRNVTNMSWMFIDCYVIESLDINNFDTSNVTDMSLMFNGCSALITLDLSSFDTSNVETMRLMFTGCDTLTTIYVSEKWTTRSITDPYDMFDCPNLVGEKGTAYYMTNDDETYAHIDGGVDNPGYFTHISNKELNNTVLSGGSTWYKGTIESSAITEIRIVDNYVADNTEKEVWNADINNSGTIKAYILLDGCTVMLTNVNGGKIKANPYSRDAFSFGGVIEINGLELLDTSNVRNMYCMFSENYSLKTLDLSSWNTSNVTNMSWMFYNCKSLRTINLSNFDTSNVRNMRHMFRLCGNLIELDLSSFNTTKVTDMSGMFDTCSSLRNVDVSNFNTVKVTTMQAMFNNCSALTMVDVSNFDTSNVTDMRAMFGFSKTLTVLNLSNFNTTKVTDMGFMFNGCEDLTTIYVSNNWNTSNVTLSNNMFNDNSNLVGEKGTIYDANYKDKTYARIDDAPENPGYLSQYIFKYENIKVGESGLPTLQGINEKFTSANATKYYEIIDGTEYATINSSTGEVNSIADGIVTVKLTITAEDGTKFISTTIAHILENYFAIYSSTDGSLTFYNREDLPTVGETYNEKVVTEIYTGFNHESYSDATLTPWYAKRKSVKLVAIKDSISPYSTENWFYEFINCATLDVSNLELSRLETIKNMFSHVGSNIANSNIVGLSDWDTSNVKDMSYLFYWAGGYLYNTTWNIEGISNWDVSNVTNTSYMFAYTGVFAKNWSIGDLSNWDTSNVTDMSHMFQNSMGCDTDVYIGDLSNWNTSNVTNMSDMFSNCGPEVTNWYVGDLGAWNTSKVTDMNCMFWQTGAGATIIDLGKIEKWDTSNVTDMSGMFFGFARSDTVNNLTFDLTAWDVSKVTNMKKMFDEFGYDAMTINLDLSGWNLSNVKNMEYMFNAFGYSATTVNLTLREWEITDINIFDSVGYDAVSITLDIDTSKVTDMRYMFWNYKNLTTLDISSFDTSNVTNMSNMFAMCHELKTVYVSNKWTTENVITSDEMFDFDYEIVGQKGTFYDPSYIDKTYARIDYGTSNPGYFTYKASYDDTKAYALILDNSGDVNNPVPMIFVRSEEEIISGDTYNSRTYGELTVLESYTDFEDTNYYLDLDKLLFVEPEWTDDENWEGVTEIVFEDKIVPISTAAYFRGASNCKNINLQNLDTSNVANMEYMFEGNSNLVSIDLSPLDTRNVTNMRGMFRVCSALTTLDVSTLNTKKVVDMSIMFGSCSKLTTLDLSNLDTRNATDMAGMFRFCENLTSLNVKNLKTSNVTNMGNMFWNCNSLTTLDLSNFDTSKVTNMEKMFAECRSLTTLNLTNFDTSNVINMYGMFMVCKKIKVLDLSSFNTSKVTNMNSMFMNNEELTTIYASDLWNTANVTDGSGMFSGCDKLVGKVSYVDVYKIGVEYANYTTGYLTYKAAPTN